MEMERIITVVGLTFTECLNGFLSALVICWAYDATNFCFASVVATVASIITSVVSAIMVIILKESNERG